MSSDQGAKLTVRRPPRDFEWDLLRIGHHLESARLEYEQVIEERERLSHDLRVAVRNGKTHTLNQQKKIAHQKTVTTKKRMEAIEQLHKDLSKAVMKTKAILFCPACGTEADPVHDFNPSKNGCFRCNCQECRTQWSTRLCSNGDRYAVMLPGDFVEADDTLIGWEDRIYGSDLLALPSRITNGTWGFAHFAVRPLNFYR